MTPPAAAGEPQLVPRDESSDEEPRNLCEGSRGEGVLVLTPEESKYLGTANGRSWESFFYESAHQFLKAYQPGAVQSIAALGKGGNAMSSFINIIENSSFTNACAWDRNLLEHLPYFTCCAPDPNSPTAFRDENHGDLLKNSWPELSKKHFNAQPRFDPYRGTGAGPDVGNIVEIMNKQAMKDSSMRFLPQSGTFSIVHDSTPIIYRRHALEAGKTNWEHELSKKNRRVP